MNNAETDSVTYYSFNAWGTPRDPDDWTSGFDGELFAGRGYTGHEHLTEFSLINMNGRVYDPQVARFLSPDPFVQFPGVADGYNRYSYCLNNPLIYTDPSGEIIFTVLSAIFCPALLPVAIGTDIGWITGGIRGAKADDMTFWDGAWRGGLVGAVGGGLSMIGGGTFVANVAWGMAEGAITGGLDAALWGNDVGEGMLYGAAIGGAFATITSGYEAFKNLKEYDKFGTDVGIFNRMVNETQEAMLAGDFNGLNSSMESLVDFSSDRLGFSNSLEFSALKSGAYENETAGAAFFDRIALPDGTFDYVKRSGANIRRSMAHESAHLDNLIISFDGKGSSSEIGRYFARGNDLFVLGNNHGTIGYYEPIRNAGKLHLGFSIIESSRPGTQAAWQQFNWKKWLYLLPRRF